MNKWAHFIVKIKVATGMVKNGMDGIQYSSGEKWRVQ